MTKFEKLAKELSVDRETGMEKALVRIVNEVILSDNEGIRNLDWEHQKELVKDKFYEVFPYKSKE